MNMLEKLTMVRESERRNDERWAAMRRVGADQMVTVIVRYTAVCGESSYEREVEMLVSDSSWDALDPDTNVVGYSVWATLDRLIANLCLLQNCEFGEIVSVRRGWYDRTPDEVPRMPPRHA